MLEAQLFASISIDLFAHQYYRLDIFQQQPQQQQKPTSKPSPRQREAKYGNVFMLVLSQSTTERKVSHQCHELSTLPQSRSKFRLKV